MANLSIEAASRYLAITNLAMQLRLLDLNRNTQGGVKFTFKTTAWRPQNEGEINEAFFSLRNSVSDDERSDMFDVEAAYFLRDLKKRRGRKSIVFRKMILTELGLEVERN